MKPRTHHEELIAAPVVLAGLGWLWTRIRGGKGK